MKRRTFLQGCCAGIAAMSGAQLGNISFAQSHTSNRDILITVFLRGGMDALSLLAPHGDSQYALARPRTKLNTAQALDIDGYFGLHPSAARLMELYEARNLALIPACGFPDSNRSHFEAQDMWDRGVTGNDARNANGWLARHLNATPDAGGDEVFRAVSFSSSLAPNLQGYSNALAIQGASNFELNAHWSVTDSTRIALREMYGLDPALNPMGLRTLNAIDVIEANPVGSYTPGNGAAYPGGDFGDTLKNIAQMVKMDLGLDAATIDLGGWDTHENQVNSGNATQGYLAGQFATLSNGLFAFWTDLAAHQDRLTVCVMSEFGRRLRENDNVGTDHGHGGLMMVLNKNVLQKKVWGAWPGLDTEQLFEREDVASTTDFRTVLSEIIGARRGVTQPTSLFPGYNPQPYLGFLSRSLSATQPGWENYE